MLLEILAAGTNCNNNTSGGSVTITGNNTGDIVVGSKVDCVVGKTTDDTTKGTWSSDDTTTTQKGHQGKWSNKGFKL